MFFKTKQAFQERMTELALNEYNKVYDGDKALTMKNDNFKIDLIKSDYSSLEEVLSQFDFTLTKFGIRLNEDGEVECVYHKDFFEHLIMKKLVCDDKIEWPFSTYDRMLRYVAYGYKPCRDTKVKILRRCYEELDKLPDNEVFNEIEKRISMGMYNGGVD